MSARWALPALALALGLAGCGGTELADSRRLVCTKHTGCATAIDYLKGPLDGESLVRATMPIVEGGFAQDNYVGGGVTVTLGNVSWSIHCPDSARSLDWQSATPDDVVQVCEVKGS